MNLERAETARPRPWWPFGRQIKQEPSPAASSDSTEQPQTDRQIADDSEVEKLQQQLQMASSRIAELQLQLKAAGAQNRRVVDLQKELQDSTRAVSVLVDQANRLRSNLSSLGQAWLGVNQQDDQGVLVTEVLPRSPAERAGIPKGSRITHFDGRQIHTAKQLCDEIARHTPAQEIDVAYTMTITRIVKVVLGVAAPT